MYLLYFKAFNFIGIFIPLKAIQDESQNQLYLKYLCVLVHMHYCRIPPVSHNLCQTGNFLMTFIAVRYFRSSVGEMKRKYPNL